MSYCVNCGVKLEPSEGKCPLCGVVTQNPLEPYDPRAKKPYPQRTEAQNLSINKKYYVLLITVAFIVPAIICLLVDLVGGFSITWSAYPIGALVMVWVFGATPLLANKYRTYLSIVCDSAALCAYLFMIERISGQGEGIWFSKIAFSLIFLATLMTLAMVASVRQGLLKGLLIPSVTMVLIGILAVASELVIASNIAHALTLSWSLYVLIPCFLVALALFLLHMNQPLRSELHRRLHL